MEDYKIERLRRRLAAAGGRGSRGYGAALTAEVRAVAKGWLARGGGQRALAEKLGLSRATLARWLLDGDGGASRLRAIEVVADADEVADDLVAVLPGGVRIEGLTIEHVAELARRLA